MLNEFDDIYAPHPPHLLSTFYHLQKNYNDFDKLVSDMVKWVKFNPIKWNNVPSEKTIKNHIKDNNIFEVFRVIYTHSNPKFWCCKSLQNFRMLLHHSRMHLSEKNIFIILLNNGMKTKENV